MAAGGVVDGADVQVVDRDDGGVMLVTLPRE